MLSDIKPQANPLSTNPSEIASNIKYHAEYTPSFSPYKFELKQAYVATAESLRDTLIERWNQTYKHFSKENAKTIHYLSMEFLQVCMLFAFEYLRVALQSFSMSLFF